MIQSIFWSKVETLFVWGSMYMFWGKQKVKEMFSSWENVWWHFLHKKYDNFGDMFPNIYFVSNCGGFCFI